MAEDYYDDTPEGAAPAAEAEPTAPDETTTETAVLPKSFFAGKELVPGHECTIRIERVNTDSVEVGYVREDTGAEEEYETAAPEAEAPMEDLMA